MTGLWIGTYPEPGAPPGSGEGLWRAHLDEAGRLVGARLAAALPAPSFLARAGDLLYAVNEDVAGGLTVLRLQGERAEVVAMASTAGAHPCHLLVLPGLLLVANYTSGSVAVFGLDDDGLPTTGEPRELIGFAGSGPVADRQEGPHAHYLLPTPEGRHVLVSDLGTDRLHRLALTDGGVRPDGVAAELPPGCGPRHAAFGAGGDRLYLAGELDGAVHTLAWDPGRAEGRHLAGVALPTSPAGCYPSHLLRHGDRLLVGVRGPGVIAELPLGPDGLPSPGRSFGLPGHWPRHHELAGGRLLVAQQRGGGLVALDGDGRVTGTSATGSTACILPDHH